jgi:hypothetical protein
MQKIRAIQAIQAIQETSFAILSQSFNIIFIILKTENFKMHS